MSKKDEERLNREIDYPCYEGTCRFCGAIVPIIGADRIDADSKASESCECGGYKKEQRLKRAVEQIYKMFGPDCSQMNLRVVNEKGLDVLVGLAKAINERHISSVTVKVGGAKAEIAFLPGKGKIRIKRTDQSQISAEE